MANSTFYDFYLFGFSVLQICHQFAPKMFQADVGKLFKNTGLISTLSKNYLSAIVLSL